MLTSIIIPFYNHWELVHKRMMELHTHAPDDCEIILVDDASEEDVDDTVGWWQKQASKHEVKYVKNKENLGFGGSMNKGVEYADGSILVFLSNDVRIFSDFISEILEISIREDHKVLIGGELLTHDTGWNVVNNKIVPYLNGWLIACHKDVWEDIGGFDPLYEKFDYEDIDLSLTAVLKGYKLLPLQRSKLHHIGAQTVSYSIEREGRTKENQKKFIAKWKDKV